MIGDPFTEKANRMSLLFTNLANEEKLKVVRRLLAKLQYIRATPVKHV